VFAFIQIYCSFEQTDLVNKIKVQPEQSKTSGGNYSYNVTTADVKQETDAFNQFY
jgi:hypothetical protein